MNKRSHGEGSISKRANGSWLGQVTIDGKRVSKTFRIRKDAQEWVSITTNYVKSLKKDEERPEKKIDEIISFNSRYRNLIDERKNEINKRSKLNRHHISEHEYNTMLARQEGKCAICHKELEKPNIDHDHLTGSVRELLCRSCNFALGFVGDSPVLAVGLAKYLIKHNARGIDWKSFFSLGLFGNA